MVLALQSAVQLSIFGASIYIGKVVAMSMIKELGRCSRRSWWRGG